MITTFNSGATLGGTLESLTGLPSGEKPEDVIVVDNGSLDHSREVASAHPGVTLVENPVNLGLARANNLGAAAASGDSLFFLNPDAEVLPGAVTALRNFSLARPEAAILGPLMIDGEGVAQSTARTWPSIASVAARRTLFGRTRTGRKLADRHLHRFHRSGKAGKVHWLVGAALWLTPGGRTLVGLMDPGYFLYFEDVEWCRRSWKTGGEVWFLPDAVIRHVCRRESARGTARAAGFHFRSMIRYFASNPSSLIGKGPGIP